MQNIAVMKSTRRVKEDDNINVDDLGLTVSDTFQY